MERRKDIAGPAEKGAVASEADVLMKLIFDATPLCCFLWDEDLRLIDCNEECVRVFDLSDKQTLLDDFFRFSPEFQPDGKLSTEKAAECLKGAFEKGRVVMEWIHQDHHGAPIPSEVTIVRITKNEAAAVVSYIRDLREEKKMMAETAAANERVKLMLDVAPLGCLLSSDSLDIMDCNFELVRLFDVPDKRIILDDFFRFLPDFQPDGGSSRDKIAGYVNQSRREGHVVFEWVFRDYRGGLIPTEVTFARIRLHGRQTDLVIYIRDLREEKAREQQMLESSEREREALVQKEAAQAASVAKGQFLAHMSHEIRTPMNAVLGMSELLLQEKLSETQYLYAKDIRTATTALLQIINDILDISKIESGNIELEYIPFDLRELLSACKSVILPKAVEKNIELYFYAETAIKRKLCGDPTRLQQILLNLLSNAVKFTESGKVSLITSLVDTTEDAVTLKFEVRDTGIGMTREQISKVFEPFVQADVSMTRRYGGTGLGLPITKNFLELMGSAMEIESAPGEGSTISFTVTIKTVAGADEPLIYGVGDVELSKPQFEGTVLICEDNKMNQHVITEHLARVGLTTEVTENGLEGFNMVKRRIENKEKPYDLIFMDINMPVMDGIEAALKIIELGSETPVVAMTANIMTEDRELYKAAGMEDCVGKPFTAQELWLCLLRYLKPVRYEITENEEEGANSFLREPPPDTAGAADTREPVQSVGEETEKKNSILIVDDEKANLLYLNHILGTDYSVSVARRAGEAIAMAEELRPDLILLDIIMPDMSGYEALAILKTSDATKDIPVIFITGLSTSEDEMKGLIAGAADYITKPFSDAVVLLRVRNQIRIANQMRAIERLSMVDQLTDIFNRRSFDRRMALEWRKAVRDQSRISVLMIDVDKFKVYNDTYGHQQGDAVLKAVAKIFRQNLRRPGDIVARWGGEEFSVLLPVTDIKGALLIAESIRADTENTIIHCNDGTENSVTVSIGVNTCIPSKNDSIEDFLSKADKALYFAKENGRNRVCTMQ